MNDLVIGLIVVASVVTVGTGFAWLVSRGAPIPPTKPPAISKNKIRSYVVLDSNSKDQLISQVNKAIACGWECIGGVVLVGIKTGGNQFDRTITKEWAQSMGHRDEEVRL